MSGPSEKALEAMVALTGTRDPDSALGRAYIEGGQAAAYRVLAEALHDEALGLERSVCLRDVVDALCVWQGGRAEAATYLVDALERDESCE